MKGRPAGASVRPTSSLTMAAHPLAAGDQITGCGPLASGFGQPCCEERGRRARRLAGDADRHAAGRRPRRPDPLNVSARSVSSVTFSGDTAISTATQSGSKPGAAAEVGVSRRPPPEQAAAVAAARPAPPARPARARGPRPVLIASLLPSRDPATRSSRRQRAARFPTGAPLESGGGSAPARRVEPVAQRRAIEQLLCRRPARHDHLGQRLGGASRAGRHEVAGSGRPPSRSTSAAVVPTTSIGAGPAGSTSGVFTASP